LSVSFRVYSHDFNAFGFVDIAEFLCKQVEFVVGIIWQQGFLNLEIFYILKRPNFIWTTQLYRFRCYKLTQIRLIYHDRDLFGQAKFIVLCVRTSLGQSQFIVQSDKDYLGHATHI